MLSLFHFLKILTSEFKGGVTIIAELRKITLNGNPSTGSSLEIEGVQGLNGHFFKNLYMEKYIF